MSPVKRHSSVHDQRTRPARDKCGRFAPKQKPKKVKTRPIISPQTNNPPPHHNNLRPSQPHRRRRTAAHNNRDSSPEDFPDLNFHHSFGSYLTRKNPILPSVDEGIGKYWALLNHSPHILQHHVHTIADRYRDAFRAFFKADPLSLHGHVSDASSPALLTSLVAHLTGSASCCEDAYGGGNAFVRSEDKANPRVAVLDGAYGAGFGPLAYRSVLEFVRPLANGQEPVVVFTENVGSIEGQVRDAKMAGCVVLIAEIVRASDGKVISEMAWKCLLRACETNNLFLVVDEALTAIRCGAPFAYQLPRFQKHGSPDLVLFGKAVRTNGVAVDWRGVNVRKLSIAKRSDDRLFAALEWQERLTEMAPVASLLASWGTLVLARREQWPGRARVIGRVLRGFIEREGVALSSIEGLYGLIYLHVRDQARVRSPVMGANAGDFVRWFPCMDQVMMSKGELCEKVFGPAGIAHRKDIAAYLEGLGVRLGFCSRCGRAVEEGRKRACRVCVVEVCEECEPGEHDCPMEGKGDGWK